MRDCTIVIFRDNTDPASPGWVSRCLDFDERGETIPNQIVLDIQLDASTAVEAALEAADYWGVEPEDVVLYDGPV